MKNTFNKIKTLIENNKVIAGAIAVIATISIILIFREIF